MKFSELFGEEWFEELNRTIMRTEYWAILGNEVAKQRSTKIIYPDKGSDLFFKAFRTTPLSKVKVVILGQDPYHDGSYDGFAFSNKGKTSLSPSLRNIFKEVEDDVYKGLKLTQDPDLERWAQQGVLLINTAHTVVKGEPDSHTELWKPFTKQVIQILLEKSPNPIVWILWGNKARKIFWDVVHDIAGEKYESEIEGVLGGHFIIESPHPSPFSASSGFFGSKPFSRTNEFLELMNLKTIIW